MLTFQEEEPAEEEEEEEDMVVSVKSDLSWHNLVFKEALFFFYAT